MECSLDKIYQMVELLGEIEYPQFLKVYRDFYGGDSYLYMEKKYSSKIE